MNNYFKHPRIPHIWWSPGYSDDDEMVSYKNMFDGKQVVVLLKLDGENSSFYNDYYHARSITTNISHPSKDWAKAYHQTIKHIIPNGWRICGENMYAAHTINYRNLDSYFYVHSIWDENNNCLSWEDTLKFCYIHSFTVVPTLYMGPWAEKYIREQFDNLQEYDGNPVEGYVIRIFDKIPYNQYNNMVAKYVKKKFTNAISNEHWLQKLLVKNELRKND